MKTIQAKSYENVFLIMLKFLHSAFDFFLFLSVFFCIHQNYQGQEAFWMSCGALIAFTLPYIIFSSFNGSFVDKYSGETGLRLSSIFLLFISLVSGLFFHLGNFSSLFVLLFLVGAGRSLYSISNLSVLSLKFQHEEKGRLVTMNQGVSFIVLMASMMLLHSRENILQDYSFIRPALLLFSIPAVCFSFLMHSNKQNNNDVKLEYMPFDVFKSFGKMKRHVGITSSTYALIGFWSLISIFCIATLYRITVHEVSINNLTYLISCFFLGGIVSSYGTSKLFKGKVELGAVPLGAIFSSIAIFCFSFLSLTSKTGCVFSFLIGFSLSFFSLPILAYVQNKITPKHTGRYNACILMMVVFLSMLIVGAFIALSIAFDIKSASALRAVSIISILLTAYVCIVTPKLLLRCVIWVFVNSIYRLHVVGLENIPRKGGAIIVCNHLSYLDPFIIMALVSRSVRFLVYDSIYNLKYIKPIAKILRAIPIPDKCSKASVVAINAAKKAVREGDIVVVFAEGQVSRVGNMLPFTAGFTRIVKGTSAPVIPLCLDRIWGSSWILRDGKFGKSLPKELPYPLTILVGKPVAEEDRVDAYKVRRAVQELESEASKYRKEVYQLLHISFMRTAKKKPFRKALFNATGLSLNMITTLGISLLISRKLKDELKDSKYVGVMIPPSCEAALVNIALYFIGKIPINLNYTAGNEFFLSVEKQVGMKKIITAKKVLEKLNKEKLDSMIFLEEMLKDVKKSEKISYVLMALILPRFVLEKLFLTPRPSRYDMATIIFSSGSTGDPKGVMLSHDNITSEMESMLSTVSFSSKDGLVGVLPFFHSFGFTVALWLPLLRGVRVCYHSNPLDGTTVGSIVKKHHLTVLVATGMFMTAYIRKCTPEQFASLRFVVAGAEKLQKQIAEAFEQKFNLKIYEGYGCTELSPVACVNLFNTKGYWKEQRGVKFGTVGRPMKQICAKIISLEDDRELGPNQEGMLCIKGPNVMMGYFGKPELTQEVIKDGWYLTGDIATCDEEGFIKIVDRVSRFSKIAGEMVPHIKAEEAIQEILGTTDRCCVVTGVPDGKKGEKLVVLYTIDEIDPKEISKKLQERGLANLWIPKPDEYYKIDAFPVLGSGKLDLRGVKTLAKELAIKEG